MGLCWGFCFFPKDTLATSRSQGILFSEEHQFPQIPWKSSLDLSRKCRYEILICYWYFVERILFWTKVLAWFDWLVTWLYHHPNRVAMPILCWLFFNHISCNNSAEWPRTLVSAWPVLLMRTLRFAGGFSVPGTTW